MPSKTQETPPDNATVAASIIEITKALQRLRSSGLNEKAITVLVAHDTGVSQRQIRQVFDSLDSLASRYTHR